MFFKSIGVWKRDLKEAFVFETQAEAEGFAREQGFTAVQILDVTSTRSILAVHPLSSPNGSRPAAEN